MDVATHFDVLGHNFLDTIDLDVMEQSIIDDVMAEITVSEQVILTEPMIPYSYTDPIMAESVILHNNSKPFVGESGIPHSRSKTLGSEPLIARSHSVLVVAESKIPQGRNGLLAAESGIGRSHSEPILQHMIEAVDAEGLLEQFEEASQGMDNKPSNVTKLLESNVPVFTLHTPTHQSCVRAVKPAVSLLKHTIQSDVKEFNCNTDNKHHLLLKFKSSNKPKSAVMLPMMVPAKRGRGHAMTRGHPVALPANCTPRRLQRVIMQNAELKDSLALASEEIFVEMSCKAQKKCDKIISEVITDVKVAELVVKRKDSNSIADCEHVSDHDYTKNIVKKGTVSAVSDGNDCVGKYEVLDMSIEGEVVDAVTDNVKGLRNCKSKEDISETTKLFDKLPSYCTALAIPRKVVRKTASCVTASGGITVNDYFERDASPVRDPSTYSKLPEYCSSFINSTRYDSLSERVPGKINEDSKASSGYSSLTHSPDLSVRPSRSRSHSRSRSSSCSSYSGYSSSGSSCMCSGSSCCGSRSRSRSNSSCCGSRSRSNSCTSSSSCSTCVSSMSPERVTSRSPERLTSMSPERLTSRSPERLTSMSPERLTSRSPERLTSRSPERLTSRSPERLPSRSPERLPEWSLARSPERLPSGSPERAWRRERNMREVRSMRRTRSRRKPRSTRTRSVTKRRSRPHRRRSRSRRSRSRSYSYSRSRSRSYRSRSRSSSRQWEISRKRDESQERWREGRRKQREDEKEQQMKERRIVYVGGLPNSYTRHELRNLFTRFGPIENVQLHFREHGDNYGFVTFTYTCDAYAAIERGKKVTGLEKFDLCFGGRRQFCDVEYADLDGNKEVEEEFDSKPQLSNCDFDELLRRAKAGIKRS